MFDTITVKITVDHTIMRFHDRNGQTGPVIHVTKHGPRLYFPGGESLPGPTIENLIPLAMLYTPPMQSTTPPAAVG